MPARGPLLVVDDEDDIREVVRVVLEGKGYVVEEAADGLEALERIRRAPPPALVLLDLMLPVIDGRDVLEAMRRDELFELVPVVVMSGDSKAREVAARYGVADCLVKPIDLARLFATVARCSRKFPASDGTSLPRPLRTT